MTPTTTQLELVVWKSLLAVSNLSERNLIQPYTKKELIIIMPKYKIIINPVSGKGTGKDHIPGIEQVLKELGLDYDLVTTERVGHAIELTREAVAAGYDVVVAGGGDGTCNEVINGLMRAKAAGLGTAAMGVISIGRGNDFAFSMGLPTQWEAGVRL